MKKKKMSGPDPDDESYVDTAALFQEPTDFYTPPCPPTTATFHRSPHHVLPGEPAVLTTHLVGSSPLWGHLLYNAGKATTDYIDRHRATLVTGRTVLELGAGAGLPSLVAALTAKHVVVTDYPDPELLANLEVNRRKAGLPVQAQNRISVRGYIWGADVAPLLACIQQQGREPLAKFDLVVLSDVVFNHTEHHKLLTSCDLALTSDGGGRVLVVFSPHRPQLLDKDLSFFALAQQQFRYKIVDRFELDYEPMFDEDAETRALRGKVFGFLLAKR